MSSKSPKLLAQSPQLTYKTLKPLALTIPVDHEVTQLPPQRPLSQPQRSEVVHDGLQFSDQPNDDLLYELFQCTGLGLGLGLGLNWIVLIKSSVKVHFLQLSLLELLKTCVLWSCNIQHWTQTKMVLWPWKILQVTWSKPNPILLNKTFSQSFNNLMLMNRVTSGLDWLIDWFDWMIDWLIDWMIDWLIDWLTEWVSDWMIEWLIDWLSDWLIEWVSGWVEWLKSESTTALVTSNVDLQYLWHLTKLKRKTKQQKGVDGFLVWMLRVCWVDLDELSCK